MQFSYRKFTQAKFLSFGLLSLLLSGCDLPIPDAKEVFEEKQWPKSDDYMIQNRTIHYTETGKPDKPIVLFIHGTPGSWDNFSVFMADDMLKEHARLIAVDRPGFGKSDYGSIVISLQKQAGMMRPLLEQSEHSGGVLLVGHSIGASLAVRIAMDYPDQVCGMVLIGPSVDPELEKPRWFNRLAASGALNWAVPKDLVMANGEVMALEKELRKMKPLWKKIRAGVVVIQGEKDKLAFPQNADFAEKMLINANTKVIRVKDAGHFVLWNQPQIVTHTILDMLGRHCHK